ncbi:phospholipase D [Arthroderma uncinatum]|uniref:phospholipase D n=1 Tax=Arthroderma uncinatum TaxID=74035 RepID=UPI00144A9962|nr:phospholipase D [Arthroderma uncinatum]KAF3479876.1 phospholipase D [Arthroderma uncinatum]
MDENSGTRGQEGQVNPADTAQVQGGRSTDPLAKGEHTLTAHKDYPQSETGLHYVTGTSTPTARRSVQFARPEGENDVPVHSYSRTPSVLTADEDTAPKRGHFQFMSKLRAFAAAPSNSRSAGPASPVEGPSHERTMSDGAGLASDLADFRFPRVDDGGGGSDADADVESSSEAGFGVRMKRKKRKTKRPPMDLSQTAPSTPKSTLSAANSLNPINDPQSANTVPLTSPIHHLREGVSEDEGRDRLNRDNMWRRRSNWLQSTRGRSTTGQRTDGHTSQDERRPTNLRRLTGFGGTSDHGDGISGAWRRHKAERGSSLSAQKWRQIKAGFKMIGQRKRAETNTVDHVKSAELLAELTSGVPAALLLASMFQRDEHGSRRIPILLEQLKVHVTDSEFDSHSGDRHLVFRIELEYGNGVTRMKWIIHRTLKDFANLHLKYKLQIGTQRYIQLRSHDSGNQLPHFPKSAFPYMRGVRGLESDVEDEEDEAAEDTAADATSGNERSRKKKRRSSVGLIRRRSSLASRLEAPANSDRAVDGSAPNMIKKDTYPERQRKKLESYLQKMIRFLIFRPDSNRLCKFLELSALGVRLAAEGSYHGKEGYLVIQSSKGLDFRKALSPSLVKSRHSPKWFLVRHSYIVCVDSPEEMHIYDVFLVDSYFQIQAQKVRLRDQNPKELAKSAKESAKHPQHHTLKLQNSERRMRLLARNERQLRQFEESIRLMIDTTPWAKPNRFDSFAPVRPNCFAQWLVDGRDYMWVVSRAISQAKDVIYIHDWWLSPELYMRRPAAISQKWRLDRLLQRKAQEGVKVFVIMYRNINSAIPIDSEYSKFSLLDLHPNVFVQRSPNQFRQNTFFWAHHEKLCIVDHTLAFVGGIDLCFGRWDTPQHLMTDDKLTGFEMTDSPKDADHCQLWPGKDYSNPRVQDFYDLDKPYEEMYDREVVPRMPWHDISMHVVGQPARDLTRHFVQRWNYILRQRKPTRPTPFLLPPPDFNPADLEALGLDGTCEIQIVRSSSMWSTGTPDVVECSIMNAYVKMIEKSDHFVYIENQFFISSCEIEGKKIENHIGDALVERIIRAADNDEAWRAVILIPLMPGFQNTVDTEGGTSVRLIMQCQYRSICRGETSIFGRLRARGIEPEDYIQFFSLRSWGRIGPRKSLVTEQLYIHAKCMVVDDRVAIIGSANINERSMLGSRDSECAAVVRDADLIQSSMNGKPYLVGRFPHTLRMRLMREHLGFDVDEIVEEAALVPEEDNIDSNIAQRPDIAVRKEAGTADGENQLDKEDLERKQKLQEEFLARSEDMHSFNHDVDWEQAGNPNLKSNRKLTADARVTRNEDHRKDLEGLGVDQMKRNGEAAGITGRDTFIDKDSVEVLVGGKGKSHPTLSTVPCDDISEAQGSATHTRQPTAPGTPETRARSVSIVSSPRMTGQNRPAVTSTADDHIQHLSLDATQPKTTSHPLSDEVKRPILDKDCMKDPLLDSFYLDTWQAIAENNTKLFRTVFRCMPDSEVKSWKEYKEYDGYAERFADMQNNCHHPSAPSNACPRNGPPGATTAAPTAPTGGKLGAEIGNAFEDVKEKIANNSEKDAHANLHQWAVEANKAQLERQQEELASVEKLTSNPDTPAPVGNNVDTRSSNSSRVADPSTTATAPEKYLELPRSAQSEAPTAASIGLSQRRRRRATTRSSRKEFHAVDDIIEMHEAGELLNLVQGHLVLWPYEWLEREEQGGNWLYTLDQISPLEIYN